MSTVLFIYFAVRAVSFVLNKKFNISDRLMGSKYKVIYKLGKCGFCFDFWLAVIITALYSIIPNALFIMPFAVMGLWITINEFLIMTSNER